MLYQSVSLLCWIREILPLQETGKNLYRYMRWLSCSIWRSEKRWRLINYFEADGVFLECRWYCRWSFQQSRYPDVVVEVDVRGYVFRKRNIYFFYLVYIYWPYSYFLGPSHVWGMTCQTGITGSLGKKWKFKRYGNSGIDAVRVAKASTVGAL